MKFVSIPYNDFIYEIFIYEMLCEIFVRAPALASVITEHFLFMFGSNQILIKLRTAQQQLI